MPTPKKNEKESEFVSRCVGDKEMLKEFPDQKQRIAVCYSKWKQHTKGELEQAFGKVLGLENQKETENGAQGT